MGKIKNCIWLLGEGDPRNESEVYPFVLEFLNDNSKFPYPKWLLKKTSSLFAKKKSENLSSVYSAIQKYGIVWDEARNLAGRIEKLLDEVKVFVGMRYFPQEFQETAKNIVKQEFERVLLLTLFPQESDAFTSPCISKAEKYLSDEGFKGEIFSVRKYFNHKKFIEAICALIEQTKMRCKKNSRLVLTAGALPAKVAAKDDYLLHLKETVKLIGDKIHIPISLEMPSKDAWQEGILAFVGKYSFLKSLEPSVENVIKEWGIDGCESIIFVPISSVVESKETLYDLDISCKTFADSLQIEYLRVPAVSSHNLFLECIKEIGAKYFDK